jgi:hypothetical protein
MSNVWNSSRPGFRHNHRAQLTRDGQLNNPP